MVPAQVTMLGERRRSCVACGCALASRGHYTATFASEAFKQALAAAGVQSDTLIGGMPRCASSTRCRLPVALARDQPTRPWPTGWFSDWSGEVALVAWALAGMPAQTRGLRRWARRKQVRDVAGIGRLERNEGALVPYAARRRRGEPISTAFVELVLLVVCSRPKLCPISCIVTLASSSQAPLPFQETPARTTPQSAVNEIVAKRMNKKQQCGGTGRQCNRSSKCGQPC